MSEKQIKFRGKSLSTGEWVYGYYYAVPMTFNGSTEISHAIVDNTGFIYKVDPKTVGQYFNVKDRLKNEVYDGDIISMSFDYKYSSGYEGDYDVTEDMGRYTGAVGLVSSKGIILRNIMRESDLNDTVEKIKGYRFFRAYRSQVIGNIHDNPNLLTQ